jgi:Conserved phage C-terminus (Phg_2220_C).
MNEYLRPSTLFGGKFESYLNSKPKKDTGNRFVEQATDWTKNQAPEVKLPPEEQDKRVISSLNLLADIRKVSHKYPEETIEQFRDRLHEAEVSQN